MQPKYSKPIVFVEEPQRQAVSCKPGHTVNSKPESILAFVLQVLINYEINLWRIGQRANDFLNVMEELPDSTNPTQRAITLR